MNELIQKLFDNGYTVTFEGSECGDTFAILRRLTTQEIVNVVVADSPEGALQGAVEWDESGEPGSTVARYVHGLIALATVANAVKPGS